MSTYCCLAILIVILHVICDINYLVRFLYTSICGIFYQSCGLDDFTTIYGFGTFIDCDIRFKHVRLARLIRDLDFARYQYYIKTGIYFRSRILGVKSLQGCTFTVTQEPVPIFTLYKIETKLVYYDEKSLFFEHKVSTVFDHKVRCFLISRQHAIGETGEPAKALLQGKPGFEALEDCPENIRLWLNSLEATSKRLRNITGQ